ncbi:MAG: uroporphyrinogen-III synthase [Sulfurospirillum sp.]|nr:uroporphyrinogen-III synthase [Sulfurospirillum sp.]MBL0703534.1 uroporphyrinogen-III synthase [Sulfurospirillum sp.]
MNIYLLSDIFHEGVVNLPQIKVTCKDMNINLTSYEALIFTSKNGVKAIDNINKKWQKIPSYSIGEQTSKEIKRLGGKVVYTAIDSYGDNFACEIKEKLKNKRVLFLRAKKIISNLENILKNSGIDIKSEVVYETTCSKKIALNTKNKKSFFIFTSPSTVECFFKHYKWNKNYTAICIGNVTAKALPLNVSLHVSKIQTIKACIEFSKTLIKQN